MTTISAVDDFVAIQILVHRYADAVVHRNASQWGACWAEDARWNLGRGRAVEGRAAIVDLWLSAMAGFAAVVQTVQNGVASRDAAAPDRATGRWYITERYCRADGTRGTLLAHYDDTYVHRQEGWQFASRELHVHYQGPADLSADFRNTAEALRERGHSADV